MAAPYRTQQWIHGAVDPLFSPPLLLVTPEFNLGAMRPHARFPFPNLPFPTSLFCSPLLPPSHLSTSNAPRGRLRTRMSVCCGGSRVVDTVQGAAGTYCTDPPYSPTAGCAFPENVPFPLSFLCPFFSSACSVPAPPSMYCVFLGCCFFWIVGRYRR